MSKHEPALGVAVPIPIASTLASTTNILASLSPSIRKSLSPPPLLKIAASFTSNVVPSYVMLLSACTADVPLPVNRLLAVKDVAPVPPFATAIVVPVHVPEVIVPTVANELADVTAFRVSRPASKYVSKSVNATCFIVPPSLTTTRSASANVVAVADVSPSIDAVISAAVAVTPNVTNCAAALASSNNALPAAVRSYVAAAPLPVH